MLLREYFTVVDEAINGLTVLEQIQTLPPDHYDVIFLDINMPIMGGVEACKKIRDHWGTTSICNLFEDSSKNHEVLAPRLPIIVALTADMG